MPSVINSVSSGTADTLAVARFWAAVPGWDAEEDSTVGKVFVEAPDWRPPLPVARVAEPNTAKNRANSGLHTTCAEDDEAAVLGRRLGVRAVRRHSGREVMAGPEGYEFCPWA
jgi:hypothetical protein